MLDIWEKGGFPVEIHFNLKVYTEPVTVKLVSHDQYGVTVWLEGTFDGIPGKETVKGTRSMFIPWGAIAALNGEVVPL